MDFQANARPLAGALSEAARDLLQRERAALGELVSLLARAELGADAERDLRTALSDLEGLFLLVVVGEFNAGKSTLVNALLGAQVMPEGVTPTTDRVTLIVHGEAAEASDASRELVRLSHPAPLLRALALVDTPGTNAVITAHQVLTERFVPRADLILFVTSADRPFTESERSFLARIAEWGKKVLVVVNKADLLQLPSEREEVLAYVRNHARATLGDTPPVILLSARAGRSPDEAQAAASGLLELEGELAARVDHERVRLKLATALGVARRVARDAETAVAARMELLHDDRRTLSEIDRSVNQWAKDVAREGRSYLDRVKTVLLEVERRGEVYFDDTVQLGKLLTLIRPEKVRSGFQERVLRGAGSEIDRAVEAMSDWFVGRSLQQWEDVVGFVADRRRAGDDRLVGEVGGRFHYDRSALIGNLRERAETVMAAYDGEREAQRIAGALQASVLQTGLLEVGGLGLGAAVVAMVSTSAWDLTGIAAGLTVMGLGLMVLPRRRAKAKRDLHARMQALRDGLEASLGRALDYEIQQSSERLAGAIAPYTRFVRAELERLDGLGSELSELQARLAQLNDEAGRLGREAAGSAAL
jgi:small GTP-binding protein